MEYKIRDGEIDVAVLSGPRLKLWPTQGARTLTRWCSDAGLKVGWYGGQGVTVRGVMPGETSGGLVLVEDNQKRLHRIQAKAVVKIVPQMIMPFPFEGWYSPGLIPESTARKLMQQGSLNWHPHVVILGSGNHALRLGSELIQKGMCAQVTCIESYTSSFRGWEVERRRFEILGGKLIFAKPLKLTSKSAFTWDLQYTDGKTHHLEVARVISCGPFDSETGFKEYPPGSFLVEWENTEINIAQNDVEGSLLDESRAIVLASRLIRGLTQYPSTEFKQSIEKSLWASKQRLRELEQHPNPFRFDYEGKWLNTNTKEVLQQFAGTPKKLVPQKVMASIECIEPIACRVCEKECPAHAIKIERLANGTTPSFLIEDLCTGCGKCVQVCPSSVPVMFEGDQSQSFSTLLLGYREKQPIKKGDRVSLLNRKGEVLAASRVLDQFVDGEVPIFKVEVPSHLLWEVRGIYALTYRSEVDHADDFYQEKGTRVEVQIQGDTRRVREGQMVSVALFEIGMSRPNDILICEDGSCGLCQIEVDGMKKLACQTTIHQGMAIRFTRDHEPSGELCPCNELTVENVQERCELTKTKTIEGFLTATEAAQGRCHGELCRRSCIKLAQKNEIPSENFIDWSFPWSDWMVT